MEYSNPEIPEGINTTQVHPLKEFLILTSGVLGVIAIIVFVLSLLAEYLAVYIPFSVEQDLIPDMVITDNDISRTEEYLQELSDQLAGYLDLPEGMQFSVHYSSSDTKNAYATLGGHIYIFQGLLEVLPDENAVAMVVAHEMAHVYHRHPIIAMGRGVVIGLFLSALAGFSGDYFVGQVISDTGLITMLKFNRDQERQADKTALELLFKRFGHVKGADELFKILQNKENSEREPFLFLSTHPLNEQRVTAIMQLASENNWSLEGEVIPLPEYIQQGDSETTD